MDPSTLNTLITVFGGGGLIAGGGWIFRNLLKNKDDQIEHLANAHVERIAELAEQFQARTREYERERIRADEAEEKYVKVLLADIEERKSRDRTIELLSRAASRNNSSPFKEES